MLQLAAALPLVVPGAFLAAGDLSALVEAYRHATEVDGRIEALDAIAAYVPADREEEVEQTRALVAALEDESFLVQAHAVPLVAAAPARGLALDGLLATCRRMQELQDEIRQRVREATSDDLSPFAPARSGKAKRGRETLGERLERIQRESEELAEYLRSVQDYSHVLDALVRSLTGLRDERAVEGLGTLLESNVFDERGTAIVEALLQLGSEEAVKEVCEVFVRFDRVVKERKKVERELDRAKPGKKPGDWIADDVWEAMEEKRIAERRLSFEKQVQTQDAWIEGIRERLVAFAEGRGLPPTPRKVVPGRAWRAWAQKAAKTLEPTGRLED